MLCPNCGNQIPDNSKWCPNCGQGTKKTQVNRVAPTPNPVQPSYPPQQPYYPPQQPVYPSQPPFKPADDEPSIGLNILSFLFPDNITLNVPPVALSNVPLQKRSLSVRQSYDYF